jgi:hypothetical protein
VEIARAAVPFVGRMNRHEFAFGLHAAPAATLADEARAARDRATPAVRVQVDHVLRRATGDERLRAARDLPQAIRRDAPAETFDDVLRARRELREPIEAWTAGLSGAGERTSI